MDRETICIACKNAGYAPVCASWREAEGSGYLMAARDRETVLLIFGDAGEFAGESVALDGVNAHMCRLSRHNAAALQKRFPCIAPTSPCGHAVTIGLGDRLGLVTAAHIRALAGTDVFPVLAQQSKRELGLTGRTYRQMLDDVAWQVFESGYEGGYGADGDHLKTIEEVRDAVSDGATMITLDCSAYIDPQAHALPSEAALQRCKEVFDAAALQRWHTAYSGRTFTLRSGTTVHFDEQDFPQLLLTYGRALPFMRDVYQQVMTRAPRPVAFEISIDETEIPTTPAAHYFIASELAAMKVKADSIAPRFCGEFQKGIDYIGSAAQFEKEFSVHASVADEFGYRISVHSGSDKFSIFPYVGKLSHGRFHLKTSGTSWVEAVRVIAMCNPTLFRRMVPFSCRHFQEAKQYYHVSASAERVPDLSELSDAQLPELLDLVDTRQVMHITYGFLLQAKDASGRFLFRDDIYRTLSENKALLDNVISHHITRHLSQLGVVCGL